MGRAWQTWLHPRRTAELVARLERRVEELESGSAELQKNLDEAVRRGDDLEQQLARMSERRDKLDDAVQTLSAQLIETNKKYNDTVRELEHTRDALNVSKAELRQTRDELSRCNDMEEEMARFEKQLEGAEAMKSRYDERIAKLRYKIIEQQQEIADLKEQHPESSERTPDADDNDWLMPLE